MNTQPIRFACDGIPDCQGQIVQCIGSFVLVEGMAQDSGVWFAKGPGGPRRFGVRKEALDYIEYAQDALPPLNNKGASYKGFSVGDKVKIRQSGADGVIAELGDNGAVVKYNGKLEYMHYNEFKKGTAQDAPPEAGSHKPNEEGKQLYAQMSAAARKKDKASSEPNRSGFSKSDLEGMDSEERELYLEPEAKRLADVEKKLAPKPKGAKDDLAKTVSEAKLRQMLKDGEWEVDVDIAPAIQNRRAMEVRTQTGKKFWVRVE